MADNSLFGIHAAALEVRGQRMGILASNFAIASTLGFKAKDIDFQKAMAAAQGGDTNSAIAGATMYRVPLQPSLAGNPVSLSTEQAAFAEHAVQNQPTLAFLNGRNNEVTRALRGEFAM